MSGHDQRPPHRAAQGPSDDSPSPRTFRREADNAPSSPPGLHDRIARRQRQSPPRLRTPPSERKTPPHRIEFTHTERIAFPEAQLTKGDVLRYYERIAPYLLPYLRGRPITVERFPSGVTGPHATHFWQKNTPAHYPSWIPRVNRPTAHGRDVYYVLIPDSPTLLYLVNQGAVTFHIQLSTIDHPDRPDWVLFDLDPGESPFAHVVTTARQIHLLLDALALPSYVKTSGKRGVHVLAPWRAAGGYEAARAWAMRIAHHAAALSEIATTERLKEKRAGRVYIDVLPNALGHHVVAPYTLRSTPQATVSMPLSWRALKLKLDPRQFNLPTVLEWVDTRKADPMRPLLRWQINSRDSQA